MAKIVKDDDARYPGRRKGLLGIPPFLVGYLLTYVWTSGRTTAALSAIELDGQYKGFTLSQYLANSDVTVPTWKSVG
ncbi:hypothetical protein [Haladaptatus sp. NG-WS-4]